MAKININTKKLPIFSKNLNTIYSRILNQEIDSNKIKKFNSQTQIVQEKSLNSRVADLTKLNSNLNSLKQINLINNKSILGDVITSKKPTTKKKKYVR